MGRDTSERIDRVLTFTGQSLSIPAGSTPFCIDNRQLGLNITCTGYHDC
jgi:hypothetical protein